MASMTIRWRAALALCTACAAPLAAQAQAASTPAGASGVASLAWLQGCWRIDDGKRIVDEQWMAPRGGTMLGASRTVRDGKTVEHESVVMRDAADGRIDYDVTPSRQQRTVFTSIEASAERVVFENLQHDFPQRVAYERRGADVLAWIEGPARNAPGQLRRIEYPYRRVACAAD